MLLTQGNQRRKKRVLILKMVLDNGLLKCSYGLCSSLREIGGGKREFWDELFHLVSCMPQNEMVMLPGDMNGHVGSSNVG